MKVREVFKRVTLTLIIIFVIIFIFIYTSSNPEMERSEVRDIPRDEYNFSQFEVIKNVLLSKTDFTFSSIREFNFQYGLNIMPAKYCYYLKSINKGKGYVFGFLIHTSKYREKYGKNYILYSDDQAYKLPEKEMKDFTSTISNPCPQ